MRRDLSEADRRLNVESRLLGIVSGFGGERLVADNPAMPRMVTQLADEAAALAREGFLPAANTMLTLIRDLVDADDCWFDHHGGCQAHGYLSLEPGEKCPHAEAKELLAQADATERKEP